MIDTETLERVTAALDGGASKASVRRTFKVHALAPPWHTGSDRLDRSSQGLTRYRAAILAEELHSIPALLDNEVDIICEGHTACNIM